VRIPPTEEVARAGAIDPRQYSIEFSSRWVPIPPASMITHITGMRGEESDLQRIYTQTGAALAADTHNVPYELGVDLHRRDFSIVDVGCGCGRIATFLAPWLEHASFLGVDLWQAGIRWATDHITTKYGTYRFHCLVRGRKKYESNAVYRIPVEDRTIDYVISTSLFTHLDVGACDGYLREISRILRPGGLAYTTFFIRDPQSVGAPERLARRSKMPLITESSYSYCGTGGHLDVFHDRERVSAAAAEVGLEPVLFRTGAWRGTAFSSINPAAYQDLLVFRKVS
jgi:SAM-dependent methyltransferase